jgi:hypothetical protein
MQAGIEIAHRLDQVGAGGELLLDDGVRRGGEERRTQAMAGDVGDQGGEAAGALLVGIIIAAGLIGGAEAAGNR